MNNLNIINYTPEQLKAIFIGAFKDGSIQLPTPQIIKPEEPVKIDEIASMLGISVQTAHRWNREGKIPSHKKEQRLFFYKTEVNKAIRGEK